MSISIQISKNDISTILNQSLHLKQNKPNFYSRCQIILIALLICLIFLGAAGCAIIYKGLLLDHNNLVRQLYACCYPHV